MKYIKLVPSELVSAIYRQGIVMLHEAHPQHLPLELFFYKILDIVTIRARKLQKNDHT